MPRITYTSKQCRWHQLMKGFYGAWDQICRSVYSPRPSTIRKVIGMDYAEAELQVASLPLTPKRMTPGLMEDLRVAYHRRVRNIHMDYQLKLQEARIDFDQEMFRLRTSCTLLTKPWKWIYYDRRPTWMWNLYGPIAADYMAHRIWREFRHIRKLRYQRKQIPHVKRGFSEFNLWFPIVGYGDWFPRRYA